MNTLSKVILSSLLGFTAFSAQAETRAEIDTNMGKIILSLDEKKAPKTVENFVSYARKGFYNGTIFHRVIDGFMIQGGGFTKNMEQKPTLISPIKNEANNGLKNEKYTIAMARTSDPHSATAQFFINVVDNSGLDHTAQTSQGWGYAVFGKVIEGQSVVDKIKAVSTGTKKGHKDVPNEEVVIKKAFLMQ